MTCKLAQGQQQGLTDALFWLHDHKVGVQGGICEGPQCIDNQRPCRRWMLSCSCLTSASHSISRGPGQQAHRW